MYFLWYNVVIAFDWRSEFITVIGNLNYYILWGIELENIDVIIRTICQELYENLRHNNSVFSWVKSNRYIYKIKSINAKSYYKYTELIRDEVGLLYKNYMVFSQRQEFDNNVNIMRKIYNLYAELCVQIEQFLVGNTYSNKIRKYKDIEKYIRTLELTYGGQTEKYLKKLSKKRLDAEGKQIRSICKDKSIIISEKRRIVKNILQGKLDSLNGKLKTEKTIEITYNSENAEYIIIKYNEGKPIKKSRFKFRADFSDLELMQEKVIKKIKQLNYGIDVKQELKLDKTAIKYIDPFIVQILYYENYLDYAKMYLRLISGKTSIQKKLLPFKINYKINNDFSRGRLTPKRNEIMAIIAERSSYTVAKLKITKG